MGVVEVHVEEAIDRIIDEFGIPSGTTLRRDSDGVVIVIEIHEPGCSIADEHSVPCRCFRRDDGRPVEPQWIAR